MIYLVSEDGAVAIPDHKANPQVLSILRNNGYVECDKQVYEAKLAAIDEIEVDENEEGDDEEDEDDYSQEEYDEIFGATMCVGSSDPELEGASFLVDRDISPETFLALEELAKAAKRALDAGWRPDEE